MRFGEVDALPKKAWDLVETTRSAGLLHGQRHYRRVRASCDANAPAPSSVKAVTASPLVPRGDEVAGTSTVAVRPGQHLGRLTAGSPNLERDRSRAGDTPDNLDLITFPDREMPGDQ